MRYLGQFGINWFMRIHNLPTLRCLRTCWGDFKLGKDTLYQANLSKSCLKPLKVGGILDGDNSAYILVTKPQ